MTEQRVSGSTAAIGTAVALIAQQVAGKAVRDTIFLGSFEARFLPLAMASAAIASVGLVFWLSRVLVRRSPAKVLPWLFAGTTVGLVASWCIGLASPIACALLVYFQMSLLHPVLITTFWSLVDERFDPHTAKRAIARISAGAALGGVVGGLATWRASSLVSVSTMLLFLAGLNAACCVGSLAIPKATARKTPDAIESTKSAFDFLRKERLLRNLAFLVGLVAVLSALLDYIFSAHAAAVLPKGAPLLSFFALFWLVVSVISLLLQVTLGRFVLEKVGLAATIGAMAVSIVLGSTVGLLLPGLASTALLRGVDAVQRNTFFRSAYEVFYTPIPEEKKRATKGLIDVGFDRAGTLMGSIVILATLRFASHHASTVLLVLIVLTAVLTFPVIIGLHRSYIHTLEQGLRKKANTIPPSATKIDAVREAHDVLVDLQTPDHEKPRIAPEMHEPILANARDLVSGDHERARRVLAKDAADLRPLTAWIIPLLAQPALYRDALNVLARLANVVTGQLLDVLLDPSTKLAVRRRVPRALAKCDTQRAADGLVMGLSDKSFEVRAECSKALVRVAARNEQIHVRKTSLAEAILRELQIDAAKHTKKKKPAGDELASDLIADRRERQLTHMFSILSVHFDRAALTTAFSALHRKEDRGMALEYLETILPNELREALMPFLGATKPLGKPRPADEILAELQRRTDDTRKGMLGSPR